MIGHMLTMYQDGQFIEPIQVPGFDGELMHEFLRDIIKLNQPDCYCFIQEAYIRKLALDALTPEQLEEMKKTMKIPKGMKFETFDVVMLNFVEKGKKKETWMAIIDGEEGGPRNLGPFSLPPEEPDTEIERNPLLTDW